MLLEFNSLFGYFTAAKCGDPPRPDNGDVFTDESLHYRPFVRKQSCHGGYSIACDSGFSRRLVRFLRPLKEDNYAICVEG